MTETTVKNEGNASEDVEQKQGDPADQLGDAGKKALDAERKRADDAEKALRALQAQLQAKEDESLTETQRLQKQIEELQASYQQSQREALRNRVIAEQAIPANLAAFVTGDDEAEMVSAAQALKAAVAEASKPGTPAPDPSQGAHDTTPGGTAAEEFEQFFNQALNT